MKKFLALLVIFSTLCLHSCTLADEQLLPDNKTPTHSLPSNGIHSSGGYVPENTPERFTEDEYKIAVFENGAPYGFFARNDRGNGEPFNCSFSNQNAAVVEGVLRLSLTNNGSGFAGAEYRTYQKYSYGFYSVSMKVAKCPGVISSFFIYTNRPWDEIDIEFLGDDTTKVQFNYYTNGEGNHEYVYNLGFDASEEFHEYAFDWQEGSITWYVDGKAVYTATVNIPSHDAHIMMNLWNVSDSLSGWAGQFDSAKLPVHSEYQWIGYQSAGACTLDK